VGHRNGWVEHACHCGHSFLKAEQHDGKIHHPAVCVLFGHYVSYVSSRSGYDEFICVNCGHPFCFRSGLEHRLQQRRGGHNKRANRHAHTQGCRRRR
jgi:hypothetical protein